MPEREAKFEVKAPPAEVWKFIRDFESLCTCIPGVERIQLVDDRTAELTVKEKVGVVPLILTLTAQIDSEDPPHHLHATAKAEHLTMEIDLALRGVPSGTELLGLLKVKGEGPLKPIVNSLFERRATERTAQFAACLGKRFAGGPVTGEAAQLPGAAPGILARLRRWLAGLRARLTSAS